MMLTDRPVIEYMTTAPALIPSELGKRLQIRARKSTLLKLENLLDLRNFIEENEARILSGGWMNFYREAANWMDYAANTVRDDLSTIRSYSEIDLRKWIEGGLSFDHIATANTIQEESPYDAAFILNASMFYGNGEGKRMTVEEMTAFALGENPKRPPYYNAVKKLTGLIAELPHKLGWNDEKAKRFETRVQELIKEFFL